LGKFREWFETMQFTEPVVLCAHSFGGYLSSFFAMDPRSAHYVKHLVLLDPWGVDDKPYEVMKKEIRELTPIEKLLKNVFYNINPLASLRAAGPMAERLLSTFRPDISSGWDAKKEFYRYICHCNMQEGPPLGEMSFKACCKYKAHPRRPLAPEFVQHFPKTTRLTLFYGEKTDLDTGIMVKMVQDLIKAQDRTDVTVQMIEGAAHQVFCDNADDFNAKLIAALGFG
jgi:pimeloyl-ACP methyl ester carboxylesterase